MQKLRKQIRKRSEQFRNEHFEAEAEKLDVLVATRELDKLFTTAKRQTTTLNTSSRNSSCTPEKLLKHFKLHFNPNNDNMRPNELDDVPNFVESLIEKFHRRSLLTMNLPLLMKLLNTYRNLEIRKQIMILIQND